MKVSEYVKGLEAALEFYADESNWMQVIDGQYNLGKIWVYANPENKYLDGSITTENGERARQALKGNNQ